MIQSGFKFVPQVGASMLTAFFNTDVLPVFVNARCVADV